MKTLIVIGKRWFQKTYGNTYHSVEVIADGKPVGRVPFAYGYDRQYLQTAQEMLVKAGLIPGIKAYANGGTEPLWQYCQRKGIELVDRVSDVGRRKDL
jgi:hypothetical protein